MERGKKTLLGKTLSALRFERQQARQKAARDLWERNGMANPKTRSGHKLAETTTLQQDGTEVTEYRLYKLIDRSLVTISSSVSTKITTGVESEQDS